MFLPHMHENTRDLPIQLSSSPCVMSSERMLGYAGGAAGHPFEPPACFVPPHYSNLTLTPAQRLPLILDIQLVSGQARAHQRHMRDRGHMLVLSA